MFVNGNPFLIAVVKPLEYVMVNKLNNRANLTLWTSLESDIRHITKYGFRLDLVRVDGEGAIKSVWFETKLASIGTAVAICHLVWHYELLGLSVYRSVYRVVGFQPHPYNVYSAII